VLHTVLSQSLGARQVRPSTQNGHSAPPQSLSVSSWFFAPSPQVGVWQTPVAQTALVQSELAPHLRPGAQSPQFGPPQSTSVSAWFLILSTQDGAAQVRVVVPTQFRLTQSPTTLHFAPVPHLVEQDPPQSTSVSLPFKMPSPQPGAAHTWFVGWQKF
jgi:hypothetical protein